MPDDSGLHHAALSVDAGAAPGGPAVDPPSRRRVGEADERLQPADRAAWRSWLEAHHASAPGVWAVSYRKSTGKPTVTYEELVEEALCFGWIDSQNSVLDDERTMLRFTPRKHGGTWARSNKERVERLIAEGRMAEAGRQAIEAARADGSWSVLEAVDALAVPDDLAEALASTLEAAHGFEALSASMKKQVLFWVASAKRPATRARRIEETLRYVAVGRSPLEWPRRPLED
jgi:uncharacterized protein YdeI (YjbR/CyaY-like superfamily)